MNITAAQINTLIRKAQALPKGDPMRVAILKGLKRARRDEIPDFSRQVDVAGQMDKVDPTVAKLIVESGHADGNRGDDVVSVSKGSWPAAGLKPSQTSMVLPKALGMALFMLKSGKVGGDLGALVSSDGHILDGHHRWAATILASGKQGKVGGYGGKLRGRELLKVLNIISKGMFNVRNGKPGKGALSTFTPANVRSMLEDFIVNGIPGQFPWSPEDVRATLEKSFGSVEEGIDQMAGNAKLITTSVPGWAPDRKQMPVIEPEQVPSAAKALSQGMVDWADPHRREAALKEAKALPKGSEERRQILSSLKEASDKTADAYVKKTLEGLNDMLIQVDMLTRTRKLSGQSKRKIDQLMKVAFEAMDSVSRELGITLDL